MVAPEKFKLLSVFQICLILCSYTGILNDDFCFCEIYGGRTNRQNPILSIDQQFVLSNFGKGIRDNIKPTNPRPFFIRDDFSTGLTCSVQKQENTIFKTTTKKIQIKF